MSWRKITMKFPGMCIVCNDKINTNEVGLWAKGVGVKHEKCTELTELNCIICGNPAGCANCEFQEDCDRSAVSPFCICKRCNEKKNPFELYQNSLKKKFPLINVK